jgi:hypothetical protein
MSYQHSSPDCTSTNFEKAAIDRFRALAPFLAGNSPVYRQTWELSTVLYLDFIDRPERMAIARRHSARLIAIARELGLGHAIVFKIGNMVVEWYSVA